MNRPNITGIGIDTATLYRWIADALNAEAFIHPVDVVDIQVDEDVCHIDTRIRAEQPAPQADPLPTVVTEPVEQAPLPAIFANQDEGPLAAALSTTNGNGHVPTEDKAAPSPEAGKRQMRYLTPDQQAAIRDLRKDGARPTAIAAQLGIKVATVYSFLERVGLPASQIPAKEAQGAA